MTADSDKNVLVLSHDIAGKNMAGPGIRYVNVAREMSKHFDVTLGLLNGSEAQAEEVSNKYNVEATPINSDNYQSLFDSTDYIFAQWLSMDMIRYAREQHKRIIFDLYAPVPIESLISKYFAGTGFGKLEAEEHRKLLATYKHYAAQGDYFVCSNERQKDMWLGFFLANGLWLEHTSAFTDTSKLIGLAPMGIDAQKPEKSKQVLKGIVPGIEKDDFVLLWTGGLWDWFDPLTVVKAVEKQYKQDSHIKLVFLGFKHPNKRAASMNEAKRTLDYVNKQGLEGKCVFFLEEWLPYEERVDYLLEAGAAIYAHKDSLETRYSHRSRVLDHIYTGLPTIATPGDYLSDEVIEPEQLGIVANNNVDKLAEAIAKLKSNDKLYESIRKNLEAIREDFYWKNTLADLVDYISISEPQSTIAPVKPPTEATNNNPLFHLRRVIRKIKRHVR